MAPTKKVKKVVNQEELRRLMRQKQRQTTDKKRVESPFAKYNSLEHLSCVLCGVQVKSDLLWPAHVLGKQHKEKVAELKVAKSQPMPPPSQPVKRKATHSEDVKGKKAKAAAAAGQPESGLPGDFFERPGEKAAGSSTVMMKMVMKRMLEREVKQEPQSLLLPKAEAAGLPSDFFDSSIPSTPSISHSGSIHKAEVTEKSAIKKDSNKEMAEALPEGFFDDPVRDAKVRKVDAPQDHLDKEWDEFQKEMRQVNTKSEAIVAEDDEEGRLERQIDEIDEQIQCYKRVELLRDKRDVAKNQPLSRSDEQMETDDMSVEEEDDEEELLGLLSGDWRAKGALA
ncbi:unnamed protein product [Pleuronectes platessa]|uniref:Zinc finger protein 830 n=1 Tax=Pleuronectes platessa TaxID=8262 RepID=A0A9N7Z4G2_PLEPL|nr:unnamed protein product [Pleuronectes platessa]